MEPDVPPRPLTPESDPARSPETTEEAEAPPAGSAAARRTRPREYLQAILVAVIFALFARTFLFQAFQVPSSSMERNILVGDHLIVNKFLLAPGRGGLLSRMLPQRSVRRGDVIVFKFPEDPRRDFIKRVVALPGETVEIRDKVLYVEGIRLPESHVTFSEDRVWPDDPELPESYRRRDQSRPFTVPPGSYFALGDNRDNSYDSRFWGPVPAGNLKGRAMIVYWSYPLEPAVRRTAKELAAIALNFFRKTRWDRTLMPVK
jgi:signal peptidase I